MQIPSHMLPAMIERADYARGHHFLRVQGDVTPQQVTDPDFWVHLTRRFKIYDRIEVVAVDGSFEADLRVMALDPRGLWAEVRVLRGWPAEMWEPLIQAATHATPGIYPDADGYIVEFGGRHRWRIVRGGEIVEKDLPDKGTAERTLAEIKSAKTLRFA